MNQKFIRILIVTLLAVVFSGCAKEQRLAKEERLRQCESKAIFISNDEVPRESIRSITVDFNSSSDAKGPTVKHEHDNTVIYVEFWSNNLNQVSATAYEKKGFFSSYWSAGTGSQPPVGKDSFSLAPYKAKAGLEVKILVECRVLM